MNEPFNPLPIPKAPPPPAVAITVAKAKALAEARIPKPEDQGAIILTRAQATQIKSTLERTAHTAMYNEQHFKDLGRVTVAESFHQDAVELTALAKLLTRFVAFKEIEAEQIQVPRNL